MKSLKISYSVSVTVLVTADIYQIQRHLIVQFLSRLRLILILGKCTLNKLVD